MTGRGTVQRKRLSKSARADLIFPVTRVGRYLRKACLKQRIRIGSPIYLSAVLEYLCAEVLELAGNAAKMNKKRKITPRHILLAVANDDELNQLFKGVTISQGGVLPSIQDALIPKAVKLARLAKQSQTRLAKIKSSKTQAASKGPSVSPKSPIAVRKRKQGTQSNTSSKKRKASAGHTVLNEKILDCGQKLTVIQGDISMMAADAVIHPTNSSLSLSGQCGSALCQAGGTALQSEVNRVSAETGSLGVSKAVMSGVGSVNVAFSNIIHVHSPSWSNSDSIKLLQDAVKSCLDLAESNKLSTVAFPSIASGANGFPKQTAAQTILRCIKSYYGASARSGSVHQVYFVLYDSESLGIYTSELAKLDMQ